MKDLVKTEESNWMSKQELMEICKCSDKTLEQIVSSLSIEVNFDTQTHIKKGGYRNLEVYYDDYLVKLIQSKLLSNQANHDIVDNSGYKYTKEDICSICNCSVRTFESFAPKVISDQDFISVGSSHKKLYTEQVLQQFQLWLKKNAINAGGQRTEGSIIKQEIHDIVDNSGYKYTKEDICSICNVDEKTFRRFFEEVRLETTVQPKVISERDFISVGSSHKKLYTEQVLQQFQLWLKKNAMNAGGQRTEGSIIKQDNQQDLFIGCVATKGTPTEKRSLAEHLMEMADQQELLEQTKEQNQKLQLENQIMKSTLQYDKVKGWYRWVI